MPGRARTSGSRAKRDTGHLRHKPCRAIRRRWISLRSTHPTSMIRSLAKRQRIRAPIEPAKQPRPCSAPWRVAAYSSFVSTFLPSIFIDCLRLAPVCGCVTDGVPPSALPPMTSDCELLRPLWLCEILPEPSTTADCVLSRPPWLCETLAEPLTSADCLLPVSGSFWVEE